MEGEKVRAGQSFNTNTSILDIHILVVDDDATSLAIVSAMLRTLKYGVVTVRNPLDALATLRVRKFDLVVTDLHMPVMNGFELQKRVEEEFKLPVIMMSADDEASVILKSLESGAAFYIVKPVSPNDLKHVWQYAVPAKKGKSVVIEELGSLRGDSSGEKVSYEDRNSASSSVNEEKRSKKDSKRKQAPKKAKKDGEEDNLVATKKAKVVWTTALHNRFLQALRHMGLEKAVPKRILEFMNVPGITRENVASHLQKYRIFLKRIADKGASLSKGLSDRSLRSSFASGLPLLMFQNAQQEYLQFSEQQQMKTSIFQQGGGGNNMALNAPTLGPSLFSNRTTSSGSSLPQFGYGQSLIASNFGPVRFPDKEASSSNFVPQLGHGRWHALSDQANLHQPLFGNRSPFYQANRPAFATEPNNLGSNFPSHGDTRHGLMNATNGLMNGTSSIHIYPEQTEPRPELLINPPLNYNFGTSGIRNPDYISGTEKLGSLNSSNPVNPNSSYTNGAYAGIKMSNGGDLVVTGSIGDGYGLNDNMTVAPMGNGTSRYMTQEGFSSAGFECANQLPPVFNTVNQHENTLLMPSQAQQGLVNGGENQFGSDDHILNDIYNFSEVSHVIREDDLGDLFMEQNYNQPPSQYEPEANPPLNELQNPDLSGSSCGEENPPWREPSSFGQHRAGEQLVDAVFEGNMYPPEQENDKELGDLDDLYCMYQAENTPSESHPFLNQEWEDEFMDSLFGLGPYLRE